MFTFIIFSLYCDITPQAEHPVGEVVHGELYQAMRKELRYAVEEIRTELEQVGCNVEFSNSDFGD